MSPACLTEIRRFPCFDERAFPIFGFRQLSDLLTGATMGIFIATYLGNVEQNDSRKIYPAKHALSRVEGAPRRKVTLVVISTEGRNLFRSLAFARDDGPRPVTSRLCVFAGDMIFPISSSFPNFKYFWLRLGADCSAVSPVGAAVSSLRLAGALRDDSDAGRREQAFSRS